MVQCEVAKRTLKFYSWGAFSTPGLLVAQGPIGSNCGMRVRYERKEHVSRNAIVHSRCSGEALFEEFCCNACRRDFFISQRKPAVFANCQTRNIGNNARHR